MTDHCFIEIMFFDFNDQEKHSKGSLKLEAETFTPKVKISLQIFPIFSASILRTFKQLSSTLV